jgi:hypothetical protein
MGEVEQVLGCQHDLRLAEEVVLCSKSMSYLFCPLAASSACDLRNTKGAAVECQNEAPELRQIEGSDSISDA